MRRSLVPIFATLLAGAALGAQAQAPATPPSDLVVVPDIARRVAQYAPAEIAADLGALSASDRDVLVKLVAAARVMDEIYLRQMWPGNPALRDRLQSLTGPLAEPAREYFAINRGPWDRLAGMQPFLGRKPHPPGAGFYPEDLTRQEFDSWSKQYPEIAEALAEELTVVERGAHGGLRAVAYSNRYKAWLEPAAKLLREAAALTADPALRRFLEARADALLSDDYFPSEVAWMDVEAPVGITIGPYETSDDGLLGYKAAYEALVTVTLPRGAALERYERRLPWLESNLPIPDAEKDLRRPAASPLRIADVVVASGAANQGVPPIAFDRPSDQRVRLAKGSKKVLLRNLIRAKYEAVVVPLAGQVLRPEDAAKLSFDAYFDLVLQHELAHGLGPDRIRVGDRRTEVRAALEDSYAAIEEAKADVLGVYDALALAREGVVAPALVPPLAPTYLTELLRAVRLGTDGGRGQAAQVELNYLASQGAIAVAARRCHAVDGKLPGALRDLAHELLMLEARGDAAGARRFLDKWSPPSGELEAVLRGAGAVPLDIRPLYRQADSLSPANR